jgi:hypothetical protein
MLLFCVNVHQVEICTLVSLQSCSVQNVIVYIRIILIWDENTREEWGDKDWHFISEGFIWILQLVSITVTASTFHLAIWNIIKKLIIMFVLQHPDM